MLRRARHRNYHFSGLFETIWLTGELVGSFQAKCLSNFGSSTGRKSWKPCSMKSYMQVEDSRKSCRFEASPWPFLNLPQSGGSFRLRGERDMKMCHLELSAHARQAPVAQLDLYTSYGVRCTFGRYLFIREKAMVIC